MRKTLYNVEIWISDLEGKKNPPGVVGCFQIESELDVIGAKTFAMIFKFSERYAASFLKQHELTNRIKQNAVSDFYFSRDKDEITLCFDSPKVSVNFIVTKAKFKLGQEGICKTCQKPIEHVLNTSHVPKWRHIGEIKPAVIIGGQKKKGKDKIHIPEPVSKKTNQKESNK